MAKMHFVTLTSAFFAFSTTAYAADATQAEADRLQHLFERYVGAPANGKPSFVTVTPKTSAYSVSFDLQHALDLIPAAAATIEASPFVFSLEPADDGTWKFAMSEKLKIDYAAAMQSGSYFVDGLSIEGIFDPDLGFFRSSTTKAARMSQVASAPNANITVEMQDVQASQSATPGAEGTANVIVAYTDRSMSETAQMQIPAPGNPAKLPPPMDMDLKASGGKSSLNVSGLRAKQLLDLWSFTVAHSTPGSPGEPAPDYKGPLLSVLPFVDAASLKGGGATLSIQTPYGKGSVGPFSADMQLSTEGPSNSIGISLKMENLTVDTVFLPEWARPLVPSKVEYGFGARDFDFNNGMKTTIEGYDFTHPDPQYFVVNKQKLQDAWLPKGQMVVTIPPSSIVAPTYTLNWQGDVAVANGHAKAHVEVKMTGFDAVLKALSQAREPGVAQAAIGFYAAQALAKKDADGSLNWVIDSVDGGNFLINGKPVGPQKKLDL